MLSVTFALANLFPFQEIVDVLKQVPDMTWKAGVPERFRGKTVEEMKAMLMNVPRVPATAQRVRYVGDAPASVDWSTQNAACVNVIRDQG